LLATNITSTFYQTSGNLISGTTYKFKVTATNNIGESVYSEIVSIVASANLPASPIGLSNNATITNAY